MGTLVMIKIVGSKKVVLRPLNSVTDYLPKAVHSAVDALTFHVPPCQELNLIWNAELVVRIDAITNEIVSSISAAEVSVGKTAPAELSTSLFTDLY